MTAAAAQPATPILRTAAGEPPLGIGGLAFRDDQGEIFEHDNPRYRSPLTKVGVLELSDGRWLSIPPGFRIDSEPFATRADALRFAVAAACARAKGYASNIDGSGTKWTPAYADQVIHWLKSLLVAGPDVNQGAAADAVASSSHPGSLQVCANSQTDPNACLESSDGGGEAPATAERPAGTGDQKFDHLPEKVDGRGQPIGASRGKPKKPRKRKNSDGDPKPSDAAEVPPRSEPASDVSAHSTPADAGSPQHKRGPLVRRGLGLHEPITAALLEQRIEGRDIGPADPKCVACEPGQIYPPENVVTSPGDADDVMNDPFLRLAASLAWREEDGYQAFLDAKVRDVVPRGFDVDPDTLNPALKEFQRDIVAWALRQGRCAIFAGTGLGKTLQQLCWADEVAKRHGRVLVLTPLAVAQQTVAEAGKFGIDGVAFARDASEASSRIVVTNYDRLEKFDPSVFVGVVLDESSILKSFDGKTRTALTDAFRDTAFKLCCTATPAPNDYTELGTHAEFLGILLHKEMLATWFVHEGSSRATNVENYGQRQGSDWRLKGHAHDDFWRWLASWSVMIRHPRDLGYEDEGYDLPALQRHQVLVRTVSEGNLLGPTLARTLQERLTARRETIALRVAEAAAIVTASPDRQWLVWCNLNDESSALAAAIPDAVEVRGSDDPDVKADRLLAFARGEVRVLVSKPSIAGWGMNFQRCADMVFVGLNDSFEQLYQAIRRCWRFGQTREVNVHLIAADVEGEVVKNLEAKEEQADYMAEAMVGHMRGLSVTNLRSRRTISVHDKIMQLPQWLKCA